MGSSRRPRLLLPPNANLDRGSFRPPSITLSRVQPARTDVFASRSSKGPPGARSQLASHTRRIVIARRCFVEPRAQGQGRGHSHRTRMIRISFYKKGTQTRWQEISRGREPRLAHELPRTALQLPSAQWRRPVDYRVVALPAHVHGTLF